MTFFQERKFVIAELKNLLDKCQRPIKQSLDGLDELIKTAILFVFQITTTFV